MSPSPPRSSCREKAPHFRADLANTPQPNAGQPKPFRKRQKIRWASPLLGILLALGLSHAAVNRIDFQKAPDLPAGSAPYYLQAADFDGDGHVDIATANRDANSVTLLYLEEDPDTVVSAWRRDFPTGNGPFALFASDLDGDKDVDLATADMGDNTITILTNQGGKNFAKKGSYPLTGTPYAINGADMDGDGDIDLVVGHVKLTGKSNPSAVTVFENQGPGSFKPLDPCPVSLEPRSILTADLNGDGRPDIVTANKGGAGVSLLFNRGEGKFSVAAELSTGGAANSVFGADLDGDRDIDLAVANIESSAIAVLLNQGKGSFGPPAQYNIGTGAMFPFAVTGADLDGDGDVDLATANLPTDNTSVLFNDGHGAFQVQGVYYAGNGPRSVLLADFNRDHLPDIAIANRFDYKVAILFQKREANNPKP